MGSILRVLSGLDSLEGEEDKLVGGWTRYVAAADLNLKKEKKLTQNEILISKKSFFYL